MEENAENARKFQEKKLSTNNSGVLLDILNLTNHKFY